MDIALLDTSIVSELFRGRDASSGLCARIVTRYENSTICFMSLAELLLWPKRNGWAVERIAALNAYLEDFPVLYPERRTCESFTELPAFPKRLGRPISDAGAWIAATAPQCRLPLFNRNFEEKANAVLG